MNIKDSEPYKRHLQACEKAFGKGKFGMTDGSPTVSAEIVAKHAQAIYDELIGRGLVYSNAALILLIVQEQLKLEMLSKTL